MHGVLFFYIWERRMKNDLDYYLLLVFVFGYLVYRY